MKLKSDHDEEAQGLLSNFLGGLDKSLPPAATPQHTLLDATNWYYNLKNGYIMTRPGLVKYSASAAPAALNGGVEFSVSGQDYVFVTCEDQKAYYVDANKNFILVGTLAGTQRPSFTRMANKLVIASGGVLQTWTGPGAGLVNTTSPVMNYISDHARKDVARVVGIGPANMDRIYLSGSGDPTNWTFDATESNAKYFDSGYLDGLAVVGVGAYRGDLFAFKRTVSLSTKKIYRAYVNDVVTNWWCKELTRYHGLLSPHMMAEIAGNLFFIDLEGPKSLEAVEAMSEFPFDVKPVGQVVSGEMRQFLKTDGFIIIDPMFALAMVKPTKNSDTFYVLDVIKQRWTYFKYALNIQSGFFALGQQLFGASNGYLYTYDETADKDDGMSYVKSLETNWVNPHKTRACLVKDKYLDVLGITAGTLSLGVKSKGAPAYAKSMPFEQMWWDWASVNNLSPENWTEELDKPFFTTIQDKKPIASNYISFQLTVTSGLCALHELRARIAFTGRLFGYNKSI